MNIAVANRHWSTAGGGEHYTLAVARSFERAGHSVTLVGSEGLDWARVDRRLDLSGLDRLAVDFDDEVAVGDACSPFDVFVNGGHATRLANPCDRGLLIVHFPRDHGAGLGPLGRWLLHAFLRRGRVRNRNVRWGPGFHAPGDVGRQLRWTKGTATIEVRHVDGLVPVEITLGTDRPSSTEVLVQGIGGTEASVVATPEAPARALVDAEAVAGRARVTVRSDTFVPAEVWDGIDDRAPHGVPVTGVTVGRSAANRLLDRSEAWHRTELLGFAAGYDEIMCNSPYTRRWIDAWWGLAPHVISPPVEQRDRAEKSPLIVSVGRFFGPHRGHSKRQLELVEAFRRLATRGASGWELHLVGGCEPEDHRYLDEVTRAAEGLPVHLHIDADTATLDSLYARASIYWHAAGLGTDSDADPEAQEHFGIAVIEAMSAGAVPVVYGAGGPAQIVRDTVDGRHFGSLDQLVATTRELIDDADARDQLSARAQERARDYAPEAFERRMGRLIDTLIG